MRTDDPPREAVERMRRGGHVRTAFDEASVRAAAPLKRSMRVMVR